MRLLSLILVFTFIITPANAGFIELSKLDSKGNLYRAISGVEELRTALNLKAPSGSFPTGGVPRVATVTGAVITESIAFGVGTTTARVATITGASVTQSLTSEYTNAGESAIKNLDAYEQVVCHVSVLDPGMLYHLTEKKKVYIQTHPEKIEILFNSVTKKKDGMVHFEYGAGAEKMAATLDKGFFSFVLSDTKTGELKKTITRADTKDFPKECWVGKYSEAIKYAEKINIEAFLAATVDKKAMNEFISLQFKQANLGLETKKLCEKSYQDAAKGITSITTDAQKVEIAKKMKNNKCILLAEVDFNNRTSADGNALVGIGANNQMAYTGLDEKCVLGNGKFKLAERTSSSRAPSSIHKICVGIIKCNDDIKSIKRDKEQLVYCAPQANGSCGSINACVNAPAIEGVTNIESDFDIIKALNGN